MGPFRTATQGVATYGTDGHLTPGQLRRLACTANIIPVVLGTKSEILDMGRAARLFNHAQRKAPAIRDRTCRAKDCDIPAPWTEAHHYTSPWSRHGDTNLADGLLLCRWHHQRIHDHHYTHTEQPNGQITFKLTNG